ncbi:MAG TPA: TolC family protein [Candidatus Baltobacteraceae bacterium]|nr:TolC family protein [Candidatus Baltobacteraceae bacterium]
MIAAIMFAALTGGAQQFAALPLSSAMQKAVGISPGVAQARAHVTENQALLAAARGSAAPSLQANYAAVPQAGNRNNTVEQSLTTLGAGITLGDYLSYLPAVREAQYALSQAQYDLLDAQRIERVKAIGLYYDALKAVATAGLRQQDLAGAQSDLRAAQLRFKAGDVPRLDVVRAQVALASARANLDAAQVDVANAESALSVETGISVDALTALQNAPAIMPPPASPQDAVNRALAQRSDLFSAVQAVNAEKQAVLVAQHGVLPLLTVSGGYTRGYDTGVLVSGPSANVTLSLPISHEASNRAAAEQARLMQAQEKEASLRRDITVAVSSAARTYEESARASESARRARVAAQEELRATEIGYRSGASSSLDVADARRTYVQAALAEVTAMYAQAQAAATLQEEMGP